MNDNDGFGRYDVLNPTQPTRLNSQDATPGLNHGNQGKWSANGVLEAAVCNTSTVVTAVTHGYRCLHGKRTPTPLLPDLILPN